MRIISNSRDKDYYDGVMAHGVNRSLVYVRNKPDHFEPVHKDVPKSLIRLWETMPRYSEIGHHAVIVFCGKVYPCWHVGEVHDYELGLIKGGWGYSFEGWMKFITDKYLRCTIHSSIPSTAKEFRKRCEQGGGFSNRWFNNVVFNSKSEHQWRQKHAPAFSDQHAVHLAYKAPIVVFTGGMYRDELRAWVNPMLKDYQFARVVDPFTAYQELSMYLSGVMGQQPDPIPEITDDLMRDTKGFNKKSFRTDSPGKKERRRAGKKSKRQKKA